jgi:hypothetical protein
MTITVEGDRISAVTPSVLARNPPGKKIDGKGNS